MHVFFDTLQALVTIYTTFTGTAFRLETSPVYFKEFARLCWQLFIMNELNPIQNEAEGEYG